MKNKTVTYNAKVICAWCDKLMGTKKWDSPNATTHSICPTCKYKLKSDCQRLPVPVLISKNIE